MQSELQEGQLKRRKLEKEQTKEKKNIPRGASNFGGLKKKLRGKVVNDGSKSFGHLM